MKKRGFSVAEAGCVSALVSSIVFALYSWWGYISTKFLCLVFLKFGGFWATLICGIFFGWVTIPVGVIVWILQACGVHMPNFSN